MKFYLQGLLIFLSFQLQAQLTPIVSEEFSSNIREWEVDDHKIIINDNLTINSTEDGDQSVINVFIDPHLDFELSATFTQMAGDADVGFALTWGSNADNYNIFAATSSATYAVHSGDPAHLKTWRKTQGINSIGKPNVLKVERKGEMLNFYINGMRVDQQKNFQLYGSWIGVLVLDQIKINVDHFQFSQNQIIDLPDHVSNAFTKENLGPLVNTDKDELGPMISTDGRLLFFAKQNVPENIGGATDDEDVWISRYENNSWSKAANMGKSVNTPMSDNLVAVSADNNTMMFLENNELSLRHRTETGWSALENLNLAFKNESAYFVASLSADGKAIVFSARFKDNLYYNPNHDEADLYVCVKDKDNKWSAPINLGKTINTSGNETSPFLSADGNTLYFSTDGRPGYGYQDVFYATKTGSNWTSWSKPFNMGPSVNTPGFDAYYTLPASGDYAYYVSPNDDGNADIFRIKLHEAAKPKPVTLVKGFILEKNSSKPLAAKIHFENLSTGSEVGEARSDPKTGAYQIILPFGFNYGIRASVMGYYSLHENLDLQRTSGYTEVKKDLLMVAFEVGETIQLNNVFFEAGLPVLKSESYRELDRLVTILQENPGMYIELEGHTDNKGDAETLLKLSQDRVEAVKAYIVAHGIDGVRITGKGYGNTRPVAPSDTEENSRLNRRVEFKITKK
jgi:outer membrane protein OmpA-like peptidoglycan-associated protein